MPTTTPAPNECPRSEELDQLIQGQLTIARSAVVTEHVGHCSGCQERLEEVATGEDENLTTSVRHYEQDRPPSASALWPALSAVAAEVSATGVLPLPSRGDARGSGEYRLDFLRPTDTPNRIGKLGPFDIVQEVGRGGMGVVLHAFDASLGRDVAVKVLDPQLAGNELARKRFCREARAAASVTHENLVAVHQVHDDEASGLPYLVMQLIHGESLEQRLKRSGKMTATEVVRLGLQAAAGLAAAHAGGLIHRDIKPGNILLEDGTDRVKLTDFGLARAAEDVKLTRTGFVAGTPLYMAPEQARGEDVDARADLFSLGSVLYEAATGTPPFDGKTPLAVLRRVADETQPSLRSLDDEIPQWLSDVIDRLLEKEPANRFQTAAEVVTIFETELARAKSGFAEPVGPCGAPLTTSYSLRPRRQICWKTVAFRALPWVVGPVVGALLVGLWPSDTPHTPMIPDTADTTPHATDPVIPPLPELEAKSGAIWAVAFTPDGQTLVIGAEDGSVRLIDPKDGKVRRTLETSGGNVWGVDVSPDGEYLVVASDDSEVRVFNLARNEIDYKLPQPTSTKAAIFSPDGKRLATGDRNATVRVWDLSDQIPTELEQHSGTVHSLAFSPNGKRLASGGSDGSVKVWYLDKPKKPVSLAEHSGSVSGSVYGVAFSPDEKAPRLASAGWDGIVRIWDPQNGNLLHTLRGHAGDVWAVSFGQGGKVLASGGSDGTVRLWDVETGKELHVYRVGSRGVHCVRFAKDGITLAAAGRDGQVRVWEAGK